MVTKIEAVRQCLEKGIESPKAMVKEIKKVYKMSVRPAYCSIVKSTLRKRAIANGQINVPVVSELPSNLLLAVRSKITAMNGIDREVVSLISKVGFQEALKSLKDLETSLS